MQFWELDEETVQVAAAGDDLGLLVGPRGATLAAVQDLTRTFVQRQSENRTDRILVDVGGYREKRTAALRRFTEGIVAEVKESGSRAGPRADGRRGPQGGPRRRQRDRRGRRPARRARSRSRYMVIEPTS